MNRFNHININVAAAIVTLALIWAFIADPLVTHFVKELESPHMDLFRSLNNLIISCCMLSGFRPDILLMLLKLLWCYLMKKHSRPAILN
jgi:hypothetical protein